MIDQYSVFECPPKEKYIKINESKIFIGCIIKSEYDEKRIKIKEEFNPSRVSYENKCFYGCLFTPSGCFLKTIENIQKLNSLDLISYSKTLKDNNLSCDENFAYFSEKLYPVDSSHICNYMKDFNYNMFFEDIPEIPMHQRIKSVNIFIFN